MKKVTKNASTHLRPSLVSPPPLPKINKKKTKKTNKTLPADLTKSQKELVGTVEKKDSTTHVTFSPKLKELWIEKLKANKLKKGTKVLCQENLNTNECCYCPLGVLVELLIEKKFPIEKSKKTTESKSIKIFDPVLFHAYTFKGSSDYFYLPDKLSKLIGLSRSAQQQIGLLNDNDHSFEAYDSFEKIAKAIEENKIDLDLKM